MEEVLTNPPVVRITSFLVITSCQHRVDTELVAKNLGTEKLHRADADFVKNSSGFSIGGVAPMVSVTSNIAQQTPRSLVIQEFA